MKNPKQVLDFLYSYIVEKSFEAGKPAVCGVYFHDGKAVASDYKTVIELDFPYGPELEGKVVDSSGEIEAFYPDYKNAFVIKPLLTQVEPFEKVLQAVESLPVSPDKNGERVCLDLGGVPVYSRRLWNALEVFNLIEETPEIYAFAVPVQAAQRVILESKSCTAVIAPVFFSGVKNGYLYTVAEAIEIGELL